jgi:acetolactate synthase-1/2/3 large subunit
MGCTVDFIADVFTGEATEYLFCLSTTAIIEACVQAAVKPIICRQEQVGVGMAEGYAR